MHITQTLRRAVQTRGDATATVCGDRRHSWREVADRVARLAGALEALGVQRGDRVAILSLNSDCYIEYLYAVAWAGAVANPVNIRMAPGEIAYTLEDSGSRVLFVDDTFAPMLPALREQVPALDQVVFCGDGELPEGTQGFEALIAAHEPVPDADAGGEDLAGLFYTGGTTGKAKGVMLSHDNVMHNMLNAIPILGYDASTVYLHAGPMFHLADMASTFAVTAAGGVHCVIPRFDVEPLLEIMQREKVTHTKTQDKLYTPANVEAYTGVRVTLADSVGDDEVDDQDQQDLERELDHEQVPLTSSKIPVRPTDEEVRRHNTRADAWMVLRGRVYNVTRYLQFHPGSVEELMRAAGDDATELFDEVHPWVNAEGMLDPCCVGVLAAETVETAAAAPVREDPDEDPVREAALHPDEWRTFTLLEAASVGEDWSLLRFDAAGDVLQFTWCALLCFFQLLWLAVCATAAARMAAEMGAVGVCGQVAELHNTDLKIASAPPMLRGKFEI